MSSVRGQYLVNCQSNWNQHVKGNQNLAIKVSDQNVKVIQTMKPKCVRGQHLVNCQSNLNQYVNQKQVIQIKICCKRW